MDSSLTSAFLYLMQLPTINRICLSFMQNFPLSSLTSSVNLHRLDVHHLGCYPEIVVQSMPKIREFHTSESTYLMLHAKRQDGQPVFNFIDLRRLSISYTRSGDEENIQYILQNAKLLEELHLSVKRHWSLVGLHDILSSSARTLKVLGLRVFLYSDHLALLYHLEGFAGNWKQWRETICWNLCPLKSI
jgi:hypothetical protein